MDSYQDDARAAAARRGRWSTEEVARFKALYGLKEEVVIARELGRSITSIRNMARQIFDGPPRTGPWTAAEIASLKRYLGASPVDTIARILEHIGTPMARNEIESRFSTTALRPELARTFRRGHIGEWRERFKDEHLRAFRALGSELLVRLGYEANDRW